MIISQVDFLLRNYSEAVLIVLFHFQLRWSIPLSVLLMSFSLWFNYIDQRDIPDEELKKSNKRRRKMTKAEKKEDDKIDARVFSLKWLRIKSFRYELLIVDP